VWIAVGKNLSTNINHQHGFPKKKRFSTWSHLLKLTGERKYLAIAAKMALFYGYDVPESIQDELHLSSLRYHCAFLEVDSTFGGNSSNWDCRLVAAQGPASEGTGASKPVAIFGRIKSMKVPSVNDMQ
jgi:hypothetical protein